MTLKTECALQEGLNVHLATDLNEGGIKHINL